MYVRDRLPTCTRVVVAEPKARPIIAASLPINRATRRQHRQPLLQMYTAIHAVRRRIVSTLYFAKQDTLTNKLTVHYGNMGLVDGMKAADPQPA